MTKLPSYIKGLVQSLTPAAPGSQRPPLARSLLAIGGWLLAPLLLSATFLFEDGFQSVPGLVGYSVWLGCWAVALRTLAKRSRRKATGLGLLLGLVVVMVHPVWKERALGDLYEDFRWSRGELVDGSCREELQMSRSVRVEFTTSWLAGAHWTEALSGLSESCANQVTALPAGKHFSTTSLPAPRAP